MRDAPLPTELYAKWGNLPDIAFRGGSEWSSACPQCGGADISRRDKSDRFRMFGATNQHDPRGWCRSCGFFEWASSNEQAIPDPAALKRAKQERARLAEKERKRVRQKIDNLTEAAYWQGWHDAMSQHHRELWHKEGIPDWAIDTYKLGYNPKYTIKRDGHDWITPTMTIPHWAADGQVVNVQHRLLSPPDPGDKYRQTAGLPAAMFLTEPDKDIAGPVVIVEGAKKAIVTYMKLGAQEWLVIGVPSKTPSAHMIGQLDRCDPVYLMLDPDALASKKGKPAVNRVVAKLGRERARIVKMPVKPDDFFTIYGGTQADMLGFIRQAVRA